MTSLNQERIPSPGSTATSVRPLFLLSLPRAGSTFVQRVLGAHPKVATASEPWILLPLLYARRGEGIRAEYGQQLAAHAIDDFAKALDGGPAAYESRLRTFVQELYGDAAHDGATYFLDKTPHYLNIADDLLRLFPDARFVFLWRNPVAILASLLENFRLSQFEPYAFPGELLRGPSALASAYDANRDRAYAVRYEDLVGQDRELHWRGVFDYLELDWDPEVLERFSSVQLQGRFGDPTGIHLYDSLSSEPLQKWTRSVRGPVRQAWVTRWLRHMGPRPLEIMGYDHEQLIAEVRSAGPARPDRVAVDAALLLSSAAGLMLRSQALRVQDYPPPNPLLKQVRRARRLLSS